MSRLAPNERTMNPVSAASWQVVTGEVPIVDSSGRERPATVLIYTWFRDWMQTTCKRSITWKGTPLQPGFEWLSRGQFNGRLMTDVAQEFEGEALEGAGRGVETHQPERGPLIPWMKRVMLQHLNNELKRWAGSSSSVNESREEHRSIDEMHNGGAAANWRQTPHLNLPELVAPPETFEALESDPIDQEMCVVALNALSEIEAHALELFAEGASYMQIGAAIGVENKGSAYRIVQRARAKAREALT